MHGSLQLAWCTSGAGRALIKFSIFFCASGEIFLGSVRILCNITSLYLCFHCIRCVWCENGRSFSSSWNLLFVDQRLGWVELNDANPAGPAPAQKLLSALSFRVIKKVLRKYPPKLLKYYRSRVFIFWANYYEIIPTKFALFSAGLLQLIELDV